MSTYAGVLVTALALAAPAASITPDLGTCTHPPVPGAAASPRALGVGLAHGSGVVPITPPARGPGLSPDPAGPAAAWFDRIRIRLLGSPYAAWTSRELGQVVSDVPVSVEVWNAFRTAPQTLTAIDGITDGVTVDDPTGEPLVFAPLRSRTYLVTVTAGGPPTIALALTWVFAAVPSPALTLTGHRVVLCAFEPDWGDGVTEEVEWLTDLLTATDGTEQRVALRSVPRRLLRYRLLALARPVDAARLALFLHARTAYQLAVPLWTSQELLGAGVAIGATALAVDTVDHEFTVGELVMLWQDPATWEVVTVAAIADSLLATSPTTLAWPPGTVVAPLKFGRLPPSFSYTRPRWGAVDAPLEFLVENAP